MRIRGMWHIVNPIKFYKNYYEANNKNSFSLACIMREEKFSSFDASDKEKLSNINNLSVKNIKIKDPDNPAILFNAKLITLEVS